MDDVSKRGLLTGALAAGAGLAAMGTFARDAHAQLLESPASTRIRCWPK